MTDMESDVLLHRMSAQPVPWSWLVQRWICITNKQLEICVFLHVKQPATVFNQTNKGFVYLTRKQPDRSLTK